MTNKFRKVVHWFERGTNSQAISLVSCSQDKNTRLLLFYFFECLVWFCQGVTRIIHQPQGESSTVQSMACILLLVTLVGFSLLSTLDEWSRIGASGKAQELVANYETLLSAARGFPSWDFFWYWFVFGNSFIRRRHSWHQAVPVCLLFLDTLSGG